MGIAVGIVVIAIGLIVMTPAGAAWSMRENARPGNGGMGYRPKTITGQRVVGLFAVIVGIAFVVSSV